MQPAHDVELAGRVVARRVRFGEDLVEAARVGTIFPRHARERAEHAGVAQHANVRRVEMLVRGEEHAVAVAAAVREVAEPADGEERSEEHTSELQSRLHLVCRLLLEKKKKTS